MNFLTLCKRVRQECGISGSGPTAVTSQSGEMQRVVDWTNQAWLDIQTSRNDWAWMRKEFSFETAAGTKAYVPAAMSPTPVVDLNMWVEDSFRIYKSSVGVSDEGFLCDWDYDSYRDSFEFGPQTNSRPTIWAERPQDRAIMLGAIPDDTYVVKGLYQKKGALMAQNSDTPDMPEEFHMLIVYRAMLKYAGYENASEVEMAARREWAKLYRELVLQQGGGLSFGDPLA